MATTTVSVAPDIQALIDALTMGTSMNNSVAANTGYLRPQDAIYTPEGQAWAQQQIDWYKQMAGGGWNPDGTALNGSAYGLPNVAQGESSIIAWALQNNAHTMPPVQSLANQMSQRADQLARDLQAAQDATQRYIADTNAQLERDLQAGLISHQQAMQASQQAHEKAMQAEELALGYARLSWEQEYGRENIQILRDRLALDKELGWARQKLDEQYFGLEKEKFGLDKAMKEAELRANPFNAVANALYTRGAQLPAGQTAYGQPTTTLDNSGQLPFLQVLNQQGGQLPMFQNTGSPLNQGGIGGNAAPNPNQITQFNFGNMSEVERGITDSLARYQGYSSQDYWRQMQNSWNTAGQGNFNWGQTRMVA